VVGTPPAFCAARIPIRTRPVAATDNGRLAPEAAAGIRLREPAAPAEAAALTIGRAEGRMTGGASWKGHVRRRAGRIMRGLRLAAPSAPVAPA